MNETEKLMKEKVLEKGLVLVETGVLLWMKVTAEAAPVVKHDYDEVYPRTWMNFDVRCGDTSIKMEGLDWDSRMFFNEKEKEFLSRDFHKIKAGDTLYVPVTVRGITNKGDHYSLKVTCLTDGYSYELPEEDWDNLSAIKRLHGNIKNWLRAKIGHGDSEFVKRAMDTFGVLPRKNARFHL